MLQHHYAQVHTNTHQSGVQRYHSGLSSHIKAHILMSQRVYGILELAGHQSHEQITYLDITWTIHTYALTCDTELYIVVINLRSLAQQHSIDNKQYSLINDH